MKKFIYSLSLILACGVAVNAATPVKSVDMKKIPVNIEATKKAEMAYKFVKIDDDNVSANKNVSNKRNVKKQLPSSVNPYLGNWQWYGENMLNAVVMPNEGVMTISQIQGSDSLLIKGFDQIADIMLGGLKGYFKNGRVYIPNQFTSYESDPFQGDEPTHFVNHTLRNMTPEEKERYEAEHGPGSSEGIGYISDDTLGYDFFLAMVSDGATNMLTSIYYEDPDAEHTDLVLAQSWSACSDTPLSEAGYWWYVSRVAADYLETFEFNPVEWKNVGNAKFNDAWFNPVLNEPVPAYDVPLFRSTLNETRYLLFDPYGPDTPLGVLNDTGDEGYLIFDLADPDCVVFEPFVFSMGSDLTGEGIEDYYNYNSEGYYFFIQGTPLETILSTYLDRDEDVTYFDENARIVWIYNGMFDVLPSYSLATGLSWTGVEMNGSIVLPEGYNSVESIFGEDHDATPVYYNMQGLRVNNPEKGQLLIVKKGNKTTKTVVR